MLAMLAYMLKHFLFSVLIITGFYSTLQAESTLDERAAIDHELMELRKELHQKRLDEMKVEINSQLDMLDEWKRFAHELQQAEKEEYEGDLIKKRIQALEQRKAELPKEN